MKTVKIDGIDWPDIRNGKDELIAGWFDFFILYDEMIQKFDNAQFLEIGTWKGRSTVFMAEKIRESGKNIKLTAIDIFGEFVSSGKAQDSTDIYEEFLYNIKPYKDIVTPIKGDSRVIHKDFPDESFDFIFIDGGHDYETVIEDIRGWFPKLKKGGVFGGHDIDWPGVDRAVSECFNDFNIRGITWLINFK
jgi:predicted O-methyltransferase YrrM